MMKKHREDKNKNYGEFKENVKESGTKLSTFSSQKKNVRKSLLSSHRLLTSLMKRRLKVEQFLILFGVK